MNQGIEGIKVNNVDNHEIKRHPFTPSSPYCLTIKVRNIKLSNLIA